MNIFRKNFFFSAFLVLIILNILFLSISYRYPGLSSYLSRIVFTVVAPIQAHTNRLVSAVVNTVNDYVFVLSVVKENKLLKEELELKTRLNDEYIEFKFANLRLRDLLELKKNISQIVIAAEVIAADSSPASKTVIINKGSSHGINEKFPVISVEGIVGLVTEVISRYSRVMLITDPRSSIDAFVQRNRTRGVVEGYGDGFCKLEYVLQKSDIVIGDMIVSSGLDRTFPKGIRIGAVSEIDRCDSNLLQKVILDPCVKLDALEEVLVVIPKHNPSNDF